MDFTDGNIISSLLLPQNAVCPQEWIVRAILHITASDQFKYQYPPAGTGFKNAITLTRRLGCQIGRPDDIPVVLQIGDNILFAVGMVSQGNHIRTGGKNAVRLLGCDAHTAGIFSIDNGKIRTGFPLDPAQHMGHGQQAGLRYHITHGQNFHVVLLTSIW